MKDQTETVGDASFIQILHDVMNEGLKTTQMDTRESNLEQEQLITEDEIPCLSYQVPGPGGKQDGNVHDRSELFSTVLNKLKMGSLIAMTFPHPKPSMTNTWLPFRSEIKIFKEPTWKYFGQHRTKPLETGLWGG